MHEALSSYASRKKHVLQMDVDEFLGEIEELGSAGGPLTSTQAAYAQSKFNSYVKVRLQKEFGDIEVSYISET